MEGDGLAAGKP
jgi:hypothetical protein